MNRKLIISFLLLFILCFQVNVFAQDLQTNIIPKKSIAIITFNIENINRKYKDEDINHLAYSTTENLYLKLKQYSQIDVYDRFELISIMNEKGFNASDKVLFPDLDKITNYNEQEKAKQEALKNRETLLELLEVDYLLYADIEANGSYDNYIPKEMPLADFQKSILNKIDLTEDKNFMIQAYQVEDCVGCGDDSGAKSYEPMKYALDTQKNYAEDMAILKDNPTDEELERIYDILKSIDYKNGWMKINAEILESEMSAPLDRTKFFVEGALSDFRLVEADLAEDILETLDLPLNPGIINYTPSLNHWAYKYFGEGLDKYYGNQTPIAVNNFRKAYNQDKKFFEMAHRYEGFAKEKANNCQDWVAGFEMDITDEELTGFDLGYAYYKCGSMDKAFEAFTQFYKDYNANSKVLMEKLKFKGEIFKPLTIDDNLLYVISADLDNAVKYLTVYDLENNTIKKTEQLAMSSPAYQIGDEAYYFAINDTIYQTSFIKQEGEEALVEVAISPSTGEEAEEKIVTKKFITLDYNISDFRLIENTMVIITNAGYVYGYNVLTGNRNWQYEARSGGTYVMNLEIFDIDENSVLMGNRESIVFLISARSGNETWKYKTETPLNEISNASITKDNIFIGFENGFYYSVDRYRKRILWEENSKSKNFEKDGLFLSGYIIRPAYNPYTNLTTIEALKISDRDQIWQTSFTGRITSDIKEYEDMATFVLENNMLIAFDKKTGEILWRSKSESIILDYTITDDLVYTNLTNKYLTVLDAKTGEQLWKYGLEDIVKTSVIKGKSYYAGLRDGQIWEMKITDRLVSLYIDDVDINYYLGLSAYGKGSYNEAYNYFSYVIEKDPYRWDVYYNLFEAAYQQKKFRLALDNLQKYYWKLGVEDLNDELLELAGVTWIRQGSLISDEVIDNRLFYNDGLRTYLADLYERKPQKCNIELNTLDFPHYNGLTYISKEDGLYALDVVRNEVYWKNTALADCDILTIYRGGIYVMDDRDNLIVLGARSGKEMFNSPMDFSADEVTSVPVVYDEMIYLSVRNSYFMAISTRTGDILWRHTINRTMTATPVIDETRKIIYVGVGGAEDFNATLYAYELYAGDEIWRKSFNGGILSLAENEQNGKLIVSSMIRKPDGSPSNGILSVYEAFTGKRTWDKNLPYTLKSEITADDKYIYYGAEDGILAVYKIETGEQYWLFRTGGAVYAKPVRIDDLLLIDSADGFLYVFDLTKVDQLIARNRIWWRYKEEDKEE